MTGFDRQPGNSTRGIAVAYVVRSGRLCVAAASIALAAFAAGEAWGQPAADPFADPFGTAPTTPAAGTPAAGTPAPGTPAAGAPSGRLIEEPAVLAILESNPQTPTARLRAAQALLALRRPELAQRFLNEIVATLDPPAAFDLLSTFGSDFLWDLANREDLGETGRAFADALYEKYYEHVRNPANIRAAFEQIAGDRPNARKRALQLIAGAGELAVPPLAEALAEPGDSAAVRGAMLAFGQFRWLLPIIPALLDSGNPVRVARAIQLLTMYGPADRDLRTLGFLKHPNPQVRAAAEAYFRERFKELPDDQVAANLVKIEAERFLRGMTPAYVASISTVPRPRSSWWVWDETANAPALVTGRPIGPSLQAARQFAASSLALNPESEAAKVDYLLAEFASRAELYGADDLPEDVIAEWDAAVPLTSERLHAVARRALEYDLPGALATTMTLFGLHDDESSLHAVALERPIVAEALRHSSDDVRFAAALAVVRMAPDFPFREASRVTEILGRFARPAEAPVITLGHPRSSLAASYAALLEQSGFEVHAALTPEDLFKESRRRAPHLYAIVVHERLPETKLIEYVSQLRKDPATADVPVIVMAISTDDPSLRFITQDFEKVRLIGQNMTAGEFRQLADEFEPGVEEAVGKLRRPRTALALEGILKLLEMPGNPMGLVFERLEDPVIEALGDPQFSAAAAAILARLATPQAELALIEAASQTYLPLPARDAALAAFADAVKRRGILLTQEQIVRQYDRYNQSRTLDAETQRIRSAILDVLESRVATTAAPVGTVDAPAPISPTLAPSSPTVVPAP
ncbi:MAG TPA: hypothetical protein VGN57_15140 [Pirellulaceae bacterium]|jgi:CheY-like chemotaxis protein|nr:hypothetical protein [Pirellulaceae bacterium]